jgi:hypothetical protein
MSCRTQLASRDGEAYYGLPADFKALRDVNYTSNERPGAYSLEYINPKQANDADRIENLRTCYYTIVADQLRLIPPPGTGSIELVYMRKLPALTENQTTNWLSEDYPEVYIFGLLVEISSFVKSAEAATLWEQRFMESLTSLQDDDSMSRWSGTPLTVKVG